MRESAEKRMKREQEGCGSQNSQVEGEGEKQSGRPKLGPLKEEEGIATAKSSEDNLTVISLHSLGSISLHSLAGRGTVMVPTLRSRDMA